MTVPPAAAARLLEELAWSECGALTDVAIRERGMHGMRAVPTLRCAGLVTVATEDCWLEDDRRPARMLSRTAQVIRLTAAGRDTAAGSSPADTTGPATVPSPAGAAAPLQLPGLNVAPSDDRQPPPAGRRR